MATNEHNRVTKEISARKGPTIAARKEELELALIQYASDWVASQYDQQIREADNELQDELNTVNAAHASNMQDMQRKHEECIQEIETTIANRKDEIKRMKDGHVDEIRKRDLNVSKQEAETQRMKDEHDQATEVAAAKAAEEIKKFQGKLDEVQKRVDTLETKHREALKKKGNKIAELEKDLHQRSTKLSENERDIARLKQDALSLAADNVKRSNSLRDKQELMQKKNARIAQQDNAINKLICDKKTIEAEIQKLISEKETLEAEHENCRIEILWQNAKTSGGKMIQRPRSHRPNEKLDDAIREVREELGWKSHESIEIGRLGDSVTKLDPNKTLKELKIEDQTILWHKAATYPYD